MTQLFEIKRSRYAYWIFDLVYIAPNPLVEHSEQSNRLEIVLKTLEMDPRLIYIDLVRLDIALVDNLRNTSDMRGRSEDGPHSKRKQYTFCCFRNVAALLKSWLGRLYLKFVLL